MPPNGLELSRSAEAGGDTYTLAPAGDQDLPHADSAEQPGRHLDSPYRRAPGPNLSARPPSRLQRVVRRHTSLAVGYEPSDAERTCPQANRPIGGWNEALLQAVH